MLRTAVGWSFGITADVRAAFEEQLAPLMHPTSPFAERLHEPDAVFVEPRVLAEIRYLERTSGWPCVTQHPSARRTLEELALGSR
jgi:hypothetical protein